MKWPWVSRKRYDDIIVNAKQSDTLYWSERKKFGEEISHIEKLVVKQRVQIESLESGILPEPPSGATETVFTDDEGRKYYRFKEATEMPATRGLKSQQFLTVLDANMGPNELRAAFKLIRDTANEGDMIKAFFYMRNLEMCMNLGPQGEHILHLAAVHYLREDEDPQVWDEGIFLDKIAYWKSKPKILSFFLSMQYKELYNSGKLSAKAIQALIAKNEKELRKLNKAFSGVKPTFNEAFGKELGDTLKSSTISPTQ